MKNTIALILCFCILFSVTSSALADDFTLRNGILFGDTMEDILAKETTLTQMPNVSGIFTGTIAGYDGAQCMFGMDDENKLVSMTYTFGNDICISGDTIDKVYSSLKDGLEQKYGTPLGNTGGTLYIITGPAVSMTECYLQIAGYLGDPADYIDYDEWIVDCDDYHVKIDLDSFYSCSSNHGYTYGIYLSYYKYTDEDIQNAQDEKQQEREEVDDDL